MPEDAIEERLDDLFTRGTIRRCRSGVLNEDVLFVADDAAMPPGNDLVVYRQSELTMLVGVLPERLRAVHAAKKVLTGEILTEKRNIPVDRSDGDYGRSYPGP